MATQDAQAAPKSVGGFELLEKLGEGAMGAVYRARQPGLDRIVALKVLPAALAKDAAFTERFQREARAVAKLNHASIVQGIDVGFDAPTGLWYFAMEYVDGPSLETLLQRDKALPEKRALELARAMAAALECARQHGIVHRDIKPANILLTSGGEAKLADLGLSKQATDASLTQAGMAIGTPAYMSPEQAGGSRELDVRSDLYSLGSTLFHLVTGRAPFEGPTAAVVMTRVMAGRAPLAHRVSPRVGEPLGRLIAHLMQRDLDKRIATPAQLIAEIDKLLSAPRVPPRLRGHGRESSQHELNPVRSDTTGPRHAVRRPRHGSPLAGALVALTGLGFVCALAFGAFKPAEPEAAPEPAPVAASSAPAATAPAPPPATGVPAAAPPAKALEPDLPQEPAVLPAPAVPSPRVVSTRAESSEPGAPEPLPDPAAALAVRDAQRLEYARAVAAWRDALLRGDEAGARERIEAAATLDGLDAWRKEALEDRRALEWAPALAAALRRGAEALAEADLFELDLGGGAPLKVGKRGVLQVVKVDESGMQLEQKGLQAPAPFAKLSLATRARLMELGLGRDASDQVLRAALKFLAFGVLNDAAAVRASWEAARQAGAPAETVAWVEARLELSEAWAREEAARLAFESMAEQFERCAWKALAAELDEFARKHGETRAAQAGAVRLAEWRERAEREITRAEGLLFDFQSPESAARFEKLWTAGGQHLASFAVEDGQLRIESARPANISRLLFQAPSFRLGRNFKLSFTLTTPLSGQRIAEANRKETGTLCAHLVLMLPGEKVTMEPLNHARVYFDVSSRAQGLVAAFLRGPRQNLTNGGPPGPFEGMKQPGLLATGLVQGAAAKPPFAQDGVYRIVVTRSERRLSVRVNETQAVDEDLPEAAANLIEASAPCLWFEFVGAAGPFQLDDLSMLGVQPAP
ncbi:MAG: serine/threonine protein kinase [Planctomycetota bacterium]|nr:serine/threonine protein kinase [Planctomycetota bacterium]